MEKYLINPNQKISKISKDIYGHFSEHLGRCIYEGLYVGEDSPIPNVNGMRKDVVDALKEINIPVLRWPGGCFADEYHWKDGIGPKKDRKKMVNAEQMALKAFTATAACILSAKIVKSLAKSWNTGFPGGWPTSSL